MIEKLSDHFGDDLLQIDPDNWENIYVIGDVHGCAEEFLDLIKRINLRNTELLICAGDVIRKGPDSSGAVNIVRNNTNILSVKGNGEVKYLNGEKTVEELDASQREYIESWPLIIAWPGHAVVHGGFNPNRPIAEHSVRDIVNMRAPKNNNNYETPFWFDEFDRDTRVFFGHTATREPIKLSNAVALDTGCVYGGELTAYDTNEDRFHSVEARKDYEPRNDHKYADVQRNGRSETSENIPT
jgi:serine/threonine protein phosphatase 1